MNKSKTKKTNNNKRFWWWSLGAVAAMAGATGLTLALVLTNNDISAQYEQNDFVVFNNKDQTSVTSILNNPDVLERKEELVADQVYLVDQKTAKKIENYDVFTEQQLIDFSYKGQGEDETKVANGNYELIFVEKAIEPFYAPTDQYIVIETKKLLVLESKITQEEAQKITDFLDLKAINVQKDNNTIIVPANERSGVVVELKEGFEINQIQTFKEIRSNIQKGLINKIRNSNLAKYILDQKIVDLFNQINDKTLKINKITELSNIKKNNTLNQETKEVIAKSAQLEGFINNQISLWADKGSVGTFETFNKLQLDIEVFSYKFQINVKIVVAPPREVNTINLKDKFIYTYNQTRNTWIPRTLISEEKLNSNNLQTFFNQSLGVIEDVYTDARFTPIGIDFNILNITGNAGIVEFNKKLRDNDNPNNVVFLNKARTGATDPKVITLNNDVIIAVAQEFVSSQTGQRFGGNVNLKNFTSLAINFI